MTDRKQAKPYVGQPLRRREDRRLLAGKGRYVDDIRMPGMLHVAILRSPHAHAQTGTLFPPVVGGFADGVGVFEGRDEEGGQPVRVRFTWSNITPTSARWEQEFSPDEGRTWEKNWIMVMTRET